MRSLLERLADFAATHPSRLLLLVVTPCLALGLALRSTPIDLTFTGLMDRSDPQIAQYFEVAEELQLGGALILLLEGEENQLDEDAERIAQLLDREPNVRSVAIVGESTWAREQLLWLVPDSVFDAIVAAIEAPSDATRLQVLAREAASLEEQLGGRAIEGLRLLQVQMRETPFDARVGGAQFFALRDLVRERLAGTTTVAHFSGLPALAAEDQANTLGLIRRLSPLSLLVVLGLFSILERRWRRLAAVFLPLILSILATLGAVGLLTGKLTLMETFFGVTVFGLGIDFAVHLVLRQREEVARGAGYRESLRLTMRGTGSGVVAGAVTTAGAFLIASTAPDPVALHLGLAGGLGLLFCVALMLTMMPALWSIEQRTRDEGRDALAERRRARSLRIERITRPLNRTLDALTRVSVAKPGWVVGLSVLLIGSAALGASRFRMETDMEKLINRKVESLDVVERVQELYGLNGAPWVTTAATLAEARDKAKRFAEEPLFETVVSLGTLLPPNLEARHERLREIEPLVAQRLAQLDAQAASIRLLMPAASGQIEELRGVLEGLPQAVQDGPPTVETLPESLRAQLVGPGGELLVLAYPENSAVDGAVAREQRLAAQAIDPRATALGALFEAVMAGERPWLWRIALMIPAFVAVVLLVDFRSWRLCVLAITPVIAGTVLTFGILCWAGVAFNVMTLIVVPLIVGLGVDDGIHVVHRIVEDRRKSIAESTAAVGRAISMTTLTTCSSFALLLLTDHPGLETMGVVMLIGLPICLLASVTALPALARLLLPHPEAADAPL